MKYPAEKILSRLRHPCRSQQEPRTVEVTLAEGEAAWNPASTKGVISGPALLTYEMHRDGGIDLLVQPRP